DPDDYDGTAYTGTRNRLSLFAGMSGQSWKGCVEARPYPYSINDTTPSSSSPDTLFVPHLAPDDPAGWSNTNIHDTPNWCPREPVWVWTQVKTGCNSSNYNYAYCYGSTTNTYTLTDQNGVVTHPSTAPAQVYNNPPDSDTDFYSSGWGSNRTNT